MKGEYYIILSYDFDLVFSPFWKNIGYKYNAEPILW